MSLYFNQHSADECPLLLYVLILCLQTRERPGASQAQTLDFRKGLLSELSETLVCLMRVEADHVKLPIEKEALHLLYAIDLKDHMECLYYSSLFSKIERAILEHPPEVQERVKASFLYQIFQANFV